MSYDFTKDTCFHTLGTTSEYEQIYLKDDLGNFIIGTDPLDIKVFFKDTLYGSETTSWKQSYVLNYISYSGFVGSLLDGVTGEKTLSVYSDPLPNVTAGVPENAYYLTLRSFWVGQESRPLDLCFEIGKPLEVLSRNAALRGEHETCNACLNVTFEFKPCEGDHTLYFKGSLDKYEGKALMLNSNTDDLRYVGCGTLSKYLGQDLIEGFSESIFLEAYSYELENCEQCAQSSCFDLVGCDDVTLKNVVNLDLNEYDGKLVKFNSNDSETYNVEALEQVLITFPIPKTNSNLLYVNLMTSLMISKLIVNGSEIIISDSYSKSGTETLVNDNITLEILEFINNIFEKHSLNFRASESLKVSDAFITIQINKRVSENLTIDFTADTFFKMVPAYNSYSEYRSDVGSLNLDSGEYLLNNVKVSEMHSLKDVSPKTAYYNTIAPIIKSKQLCTSDFSEEPVGDCYLVNPMIINPTEEVCENNSIYQGYMMMPNWNFLESVEYFDCEFLSTYNTNQDQQPLEDSWNMRYSDYLRDTTEYVKAIYTGYSESEAKTLYPLANDIEQLSGSPESEFFSKTPYKRVGVNPMMDIRLYEYWSVLNPETQGCTTNPTLTLQSVFPSVTHFQYLPKMDSISEALETPGNPGELRIAEDTTLYWNPISQEWLILEEYSSDCITNSLSQALTIVNISSHGYMSAYNELNLSFLSYVLYYNAVEFQVKKFILK